MISTKFISSGRLYNEVRQELRAAMTRPWRPPRNLLISVIGTFGWG